MTESKEVTVAQKIFEKFIMASCCDPSELGVMMAKDGKGRVETFLCLDKTPIALLLTKRELEKWTPLYKFSEKMDDVFKKERRKMRGPFGLGERKSADWATPQDFGDGTIIPVFDFDSPVLKNLEETAQKLK